jgi:hypothetical protein
VLTSSFNKPGAKDDRGPLALAWAIVLRLFRPSIALEALEVQYCPNCGHTYDLHADKHGCDGGDYPEAVLAITAIKRAKM